MNFLLLLFCTFIFAYTASSTLINEKVGFTHTKFNNFLKKAALGFREIILHGDESFGYPVMEPHQIPDLHLHNISEKWQSLRLSLENTRLTGLSDYLVHHASCGLVDLKCHLRLEFLNLKLQGHYQLNVNEFNNFLPFDSNGDFTIFLDKFALGIRTSFAVEQSQIVQEKTQIRLSPFKRLLSDVSITNSLNIHTDFFTSIFTEILSHSQLELPINDILSNHAQKLVEESIGGMTMNELFEFLDYFADKAY